MAGSDRQERAFDAAGNVVAGLPHAATGDAAERHDDVVAQVADEAAARAAADTLIPGTITALTGDVTAAGMGSVAATLANLPQVVLLARTNALTADVPMNTHKFTGLSDGSNPQDSLAFHQLGDALAAQAFTVADDVDVAAVTAGDGAIRVVACYHDLFRLDKTTTRTAVPNVVIQSTVNAAWFWVRLMVPDPLWATFGFVTVDPVNGSDKAFGFATSMAAADAVALKSLDELNRRLPNGGFNGDVVCHVLDSIPGAEADSMILTRLHVQSYDSKFIIIGALTSAARPSLFSGTVSGYFAAAPSTNTKRQLTLTGAPAGLVGKLIQKADGSKSAFVLKDLGGGSYRISRPRTCNPLTGAEGTNTEFANSDTVVVYDLPTMPIYPFPATAFTNSSDDASGNLILSNFEVRAADPGDPASFILGASSSRLINCIIVDPIIMGGTKCMWTNILFVGATIGLAFVSGSQFFMLNSIALLNTQILMDYVTLDITDAIDIEGDNGNPAFAHLMMQHGHNAVTLVSGELGIFNSHVSAIAGFTPSSFAFNNMALYGTGNTGVFYGPPPGGRWTIGFQNFALTSAPGPIVVQGTYYQYSDCPLSLAFDQVMIGTF